MMNSRHDAGLAILSLRPTRESVQIGSYTAAVQSARRNHDRRLVVMRAWIAAAVAARLRIVIAGIIGGGIDQIALPV